MEKQILTNRPQAKPPVKKKNWLTGDTGEKSSKRLIGFIAFAMIVLGYVANLFWDLEVDEFMYDNMMYVVVAGLITVVAEKFSPKK